MSTPAAGWYDDGQGQQRYWDGVRWTEHVAPLAPVPDAAASAQQQAAVAAVPAQGAFAAPTAPQAPGAPGAPAHAVAGVAPIAQGPYPPAPPAPRSSLKGLWIALIVVGGVVVIGAIVTVSLLLFLPRSSPDQTVRDYNSAWHDGNCDAIERLTTQSWKSTYAFDCSSVVAAPGPAWKVSFLSLDQSSDVALVEYTVSGKGANGQSFSQTYDARLVDDGGTWLIDSDELVSSE